MFSMGLMNLSAFLLLDSLYLPKLAEHSEVVIVISQYRNIQISTTPFPLVVRDTSYPNDVKACIYNINAHVLFIWRFPLYGKENRQN